MPGREFEEFIDDILDADFEVDDIKRIVKSMDSGIDSLDAEKLIPEFCSLRYRYAFMYLAFSAIYLIAKPKEDYQRNLKHIKRAMRILGMLVHEMTRLQEAIEEEEEDKDGTGEQQD
jgi:hypothetical protein